MSLKCPECKSTERFVSNQYIEHHDAVFDGSGTCVEDYGCYESWHDVDGATCMCLSCGHEGNWSDFERD